MMSTSEILVIVFAVFLLFGGKRVPEILRTIGRMTTSFQQTWNGLKKEAGLDVFDDVKQTISRDLNPLKNPPRPNNLEKKENEKPE
jgi:sec-independent protein translocase protein TatA